MTLKKVLFLLLLAALVAASINPAFGQPPDSPSTNGSDFLVEGEEKKTTNGQKPAPPTQSVGQDPAPVPTPAADSIRDYSNDQVKMDAILEQAEASRRQLEGRVTAAENQARAAHSRIAASEKGLANNQRELGGLTKVVRSDRQTLKVTVKAVNRHESLLRKSTSVDFNQNKSIDLLTERVDGLGRTVGYHTAGFAVLLLAGICAPLALKFRSGRIAKSKKGGAV